MHRNGILSILNEYGGVYPEEQAMVGRIVALVRDHPDCFERTCMPGHITGSALVVSEDRKQYLLTHHRKLNRWLQPGGHADGDPEPHRVALREAQEESGMSEFSFFETNGLLLPLDVDVHQIPPHKSTPAHEHHDMRYLLIAAAGQEIHVSDESHDVRWFTGEELLKITDEESILRMLRKAEKFLNGKM